MPDVPTVWPNGGRVHVTVNPRYVSSDRGVMADPMYKVYQVVYQEVELDLICMDLEVFGKIRLTNPDQVTLMRSVCEDLKLEQTSIEFVSMQGRILENPSNIARLKTGDVLDVKLVSRVDRQKRFRGKCQDCSCWEYRRPERGNDCAVCRHAVVAHEWIQNTQDEKQDNASSKQAVSVVFSKVKEVPILPKQSFRSLLLRVLLVLLLSFFTLPDS
eukprot:TRINITY_DN7185_c0_g1_i2.p1 TRINITY_DN7185_c0_g1~~TRINITY_DN7185_c0_g1_i2.p1  ORF type:complete len:215 (-),score=53.69 TRINITY_DN7185_c0_g1_i2:763-1407(-)